MTDKTLHKDINLIERDCGRWDWEFQYGDIIITDGTQSLRNGLIMACLTSWNYLNRKGNTLYETFGNRAYEELNKKKCTIREYLIQQYFTEVLNRMRRVNRIISLTVKDSPSDPNEYDVFFTVEAINDTIVTGDFTITTNELLSTSTITVTSDNTSASSNKPITYTIKLLTEYGTPLANEIVYAYVDNEYSGTSTVTNNNGECTYKQYSTLRLGWEQIQFQFKGNNYYNPVLTEQLSFLSVPYHFSQSDDHLILTKKEGTPTSSWLGVIVETIEDIPSTDDGTETYYLIKETDNTYTRYKTKEEQVETDVYHLINQPTNINTGEIRLFIENNQNEIIIIDDHIYGDITI